LVPALGKRKLRDLTATEVDRWLHDRAKVLSTSSLHGVLACLNRSIHRAMARGLVHQNVAALCQVPTGQRGRPSKSLTRDQARAVLDAADGHPLHAYVVLSILIGARTEELRRLGWERVHLAGRPGEPPSVELWHSVRVGGDTKTKKSRRTPALPARCVLALRGHLGRQQAERVEAGMTWTEDGLVFATRLGTALDAANVRRSFRQILTETDLDPAGWTPRDLRHSFVSLLSAGGLSVEQIADLCGHSGTTVTETVYRHELRPVLLAGAIAMDRILPPGERLR
jgi:integrase